MEATAVSIARSVMNGALGHAKSAVAEEMAMQLGVQRDKAFIADELEMMRSVVLMERREDDVATTWVRQVRDVAYDVEDGLRDLVLRVHGQSSWWRVLLDRRLAAEEMKELRAKVEDVSQRSVRYCLINAASTAPDLSVATAAAAVEEATRHVANQQRSPNATYSSNVASSSMLPYTFENEIQEGQSNAHVDGMTMVQERLKHTYNVEGINCGVVQWIDFEWPDSMEKTLAKLWDMYEESKTARTKDNLEISFVVHNLTQEKNKLEENYEKLVANVSALLDAQEQRVVELNYQQVQKDNVDDKITQLDNSLGNLKEELAKKEEENSKLQEKYDTLKHLTGAQANVIRNLKFNHLKEKERLTEDRHKIAVSHF